MVYATTGSNSFRATQSITGSLTVTGQIIAQTLNVQQVTSSIIYSSGSNNFGCDLNSRQTFTGSMNVTGSGTFAGNITAGSTIQVKGYAAPSNGAGLELFYLNGEGRLFAYDRDCTSYKSMGLGVGGTQLYLTGSGAVGIGTSSPISYGTQRFLVLGTGAASQVARFTDGSNGDLVFDNPSAGITRITAQYGTDGTLVFAKGTGFVETMRITSCGNVGIGCTSPSGKLQVANSGTQYALYTAGGNLELYTPEGNCGYVRLGSAYNLNGVYGSCGLNYIISGTSNHVFYTTDGPTERMRISCSGAVGIGATAPAYNLHVCCSNNVAYIAIETGACTASMEATFLQKTPDGIALMALGASAARGVGDAARCDWTLSLRTGGCLRFSSQVAANNTHFLLAPNGVACFASTVCAPVGLFSGCVVIGSSACSPRSLLDIRPANNTGQVLLIGEGGNTRTGFGLDSGTAGMRIFTTYSNNQMIDIGGIGSDGSTWTRNHRFGIAGCNSFLNECGGNVGIGTVSPLSTFVVNGNNAGGRGGEISIVNISGTTVGSEAALNFGFGASSYNGDSGNGQIKAVFASGNEATDMVFSNWNGSAWGEKMRITAAGLVTFNCMISAQGGCFKSATDARALFLKQNTVNSDNIIQFIDHNGTYAWEVVGRNSVFYIYNAAVSNFSMCINPSTNAVHFPGAVSKGSGTFNIEHPLDSKKCTHRLVHSFIEGPQADLIYRGKINLDNGIACVNIDCASRMTEGTFEALNRCAQVFTTNESSWSAIRGKLQGNILVIESQNTESNDEISWMVIGERQDKHIKDTSITDSLGRIITEPEVEAPFTCTQ